MNKSKKGEREGFWTKMFEPDSGQVMFLTVMILGSVIASVTVIAGLLMSYQIRRSADVSHSARAIFAADAGVECMLYEIFKEGRFTDESFAPTAQSICNGNNRSNLENDAEFEIEVGGSVRPESRLHEYYIAKGSYRGSVRQIRIELRAR